MSPYSNADMYRAIRISTSNLLKESGATGHEGVPACPGWTVRDLLAHLVGLVDSWLGGDLEVYASPAWTAGHLAAWADRDVAELATAWQELGDRLAVDLDDLEGVDRLPRTITTVVGPAPLPTFASGIVIDAMLHHQDLAAALGADATDHPFQVHLTKILVSAAGESWRRADHEPVAVLSADDGPLGQLGRGDAARSVTGTTFDLIRSLGGRRTLAQIRQLGWRSEPPPRVDEFVVRFFEPPPVPVEAGPSPV